MITQTEFRKWLVENTALTPRVVNDVLCRMRRADSIIAFTDATNYLEQLRKEEAYKKLSVPVRSQIKRAVLYYIDSLEAN